jgi:hypothetical protein
LSCLVWSETRERGTRQLIICCWCWRLSSLLYVSYPEMGDSRGRSSTAMYCTSRRGRRSSGQGQVRSVARSKGRQGLGAQERSPTPKSTSPHHPPWVGLMGMDCMSCKYARTVLGMDYCMDTLGCGWTRSLGRGRDGRAGQGGGLCFNPAMFVSLQCLLQWPEHGIVPQSLDSGRERGREREG